MSDKAERAAESALALWRAQRELEEAKTWANEEGLALATEKLENAEDECDAAFRDWKPEDGRMGWMRQEWLVRRIRRTRNQNRGSFSLPCFCSSKSTCRHAKFTQSD